MLGLRQASRLTLKLADGLCLNALSSYKQQCRQRLYRFSTYENVSRHFSVGVNSATAECNTEDDKVTKQAVAKLEARLMIQFTCKKCSTRNSNTMTKLAYERGVVIIRCSGCKNNHLIADNLGWFGSDPAKRNIEKLMKLNGETVKKLGPYNNELFEWVHKEEATTVDNVNKK